MRLANVSLWSLAGLLCSAFALGVMIDIPVVAMILVLLTVGFLLAFVGAGVASMLAATGTAVVESAHAVSVIHRKAQRRLFMKERPSKRLLSAEVASELARRNKQGE